ncbi:MAG: DUF5916 domain-containing protein [Gemmatimonadota bacterium]|nr:DUF5916 domain-containing protein [Gemmatimonadota bacterium]
MHRIPSLAIAALAAAGLGLTAPAAAQTSNSDQARGSGTAGGDFSPQVKPVLDVERAPGEIEIDGDLNDPGWENAAKATGFTEFNPDEGAAPPVRSEVLVTYDDENLYLGLIAHDDPSTIRTSIQDRDQIFSDDLFGIMLDTYGDAAWAYEIFANPSGVQGDIRFSQANGEDVGFDLVFDAEAKITGDGYQVEMAIPFKSLRFPDRPEQEWRATFVRIRPRESRAQYSWAAFDRDEQCLACQFGTLRGIRGVEPGGALELLPAVVASHSSELDDPDDPDSGLGDGEFDGEASLTARYAHPSGVTLEGTINPDFSQVESDVAQIDVNTTFALFFPERRPFFQEGSELFETYIDLVYTRQINDPQVAAKSIVRRGRTAIAYLGARDENSPILLPFQERSFVGLGEESFSNILRARRTYGSNSYVGGMVTDRRFENGGGSGTTFGVDGVHRFLDNYRFEYQLAGSHTDEPEQAGSTARLEGLTFDDGAHTAVFDGESFSGWGGYASLERSAEFWSFDLDYWTSSPTFRADNGFETRNDFHRAIAFTEVSWYPERSWIDQFTADVRASQTWTHDGGKDAGYVNPTLEFSLTGQTFVELGPRWEYERFRGLDFDGMFEWFVFARSNAFDRVQGGFFFEQGDDIARNLETPAVGEGTFLNVFATLKPIDRLTIEPSVRWSRLEVDGEEIFDGYIFRARANFNVTRRLFGRLVLQYDEFDEAFDVEPLVTYRINPFTLFYLGSTSTLERFDDPHDEFVETERQYFAKVQYLFQP